MKKVENVIMSMSTRLSPIYQPIIQNFQESLEFLEIERKKNKAKDYLIQKYNSTIKSNNLQEGDLHGKQKKKIFDKPFFLIVGSRSTHKNVDTLVYAISGLEKELKRNFDVVAVSGGEFPQTYLNLFSPAGVHVIDHVEEEDLPQIYGMAMATVYLAEFKGFGMPVIESLACGTPVICGEEWDDLPNDSPEVVIKVSKFNIFKVRDALKKILGMEERGELTTLDNVLKRIQAVCHYGSKFCQQHGWKEMSLEILEFILKGKSRGTQCNF